MTIYPKRLLKAVSYTAISLFIIFHEFGTNFLGANVRWRDSLEVWSENYSGFVQGMVSFFLFVFAVVVLIYLTKGIYYFFTLGVEKNGVFENSIRTKFSKPCSGFDGDGSGIERMKVYRNSKLANMSNSDGVELLKETAWLDGMVNDAGQHTASVRRFVGAKLTTMSNEDGLGFLKK